MIKVAKGRIDGRLAKGELGAEKGLVILLPGKLDDAVVGHKALHDGPARRFGASGAPHHLGEQREGTLARAKIVLEEQRVGKQDADQRHVGQVKPLCHHLGAKQDVILPF